MKYIFSFFILLIANITFSQNGSKEDVVPFSLVDEIPITKGCKSKWKKEKLKKCVMKSISMHVIKKYNTDLAGNIGLTGRIKITNTFVINKEGEITNISAVSPHEQLTSEAIRVIKLLPKMAPGKHNGEITSVEYELPIIFQVQD